MATYVEVSNVRYVNADNVQQVFVDNVGGGTPYVVTIVTSVSSYQLPGMAYAVQADAEAATRRVVTALGELVDPNTALA